MKKASSLLLLIIFLLFTACSLKRVENHADDLGESHAIFNNEYGGKMFNRSVFNKDRGTLVNKKELFTGLHIYDLDNGSEMTVCNVAGCLHGDDKNCMANTFPFSLNNSVLYGNHIVLPVEKESVSKLVYMEIDGSNQREIVSWPGYTAMFSTCPVLIDNFAYFQVVLLKNEVDEYGYVVASEGFSELYSINMGNGNTTCLYKSEVGREASASQFIGVGKDKLCISYTVRKNNYLDLGMTGEEYFSKLGELYADESFIERLGEEKKTIIYDLANNDTIDISKDCSELSMQLWNDCLIKGFLDGNMEVYDLNKKAFDKVSLNVDTTSMTISIYKDFALLVNKTSDLQYEYYLMAPDSFDIYKIVPPYKDKYFDNFDDESEEYVSLVLKDIGEEFMYTGDDDINIEYVSKEELYSWIVY